MIGSYRGSAFASARVEPRGMDRGRCPMAIRRPVFHFGGAGGAE